MTELYGSFLIILSIIHIATGLLGAIAISTQRHKLLWPVLATTLIKVLLFAREFTLI